MSDQLTHFHKSVVMSARHMDFLILMKMNGVAKDL